MVPLRFTAGTSAVCLAACLCVAMTVARAEPAPVDYFHYPLRSGESLTDVSRIFRIPVQELIELNGIVDPHRMSVGQSLKVPNVFARDAALLQIRYERLLEENRRIEHDSADRHHAMVALEERAAHLERTNAMLEHELAAAGHWQNAAKLCGVLLLVALAWAIKTRFDRALLERKMHRVVAENAALTTAKEKYREAAAQLELRYQKLYRGHGEGSREMVADGEARLARAFAEGSARLEGLLAAVRAETEDEEPPADRKGRPVLHPIRELLGRQRLKYRTP